MKFAIPFLAATTLGAVALLAQESTTPVGYVTQQLVQGFNLVGLTLHNEPAAAGDFETVSGTTLTDSDLSFTPVAGRLYILEIVDAADPSLIGTVQDLADTDISGTNFTTGDDLDALGLAAGDSYILRLVPTLEELFGTTSGVLQASLSSAGADIVWIPNGSGGYNKYFLHISGEYRIEATTTAAPNIPIPYVDGFFIQKKGATPTNLIVLGEVKTVGTISVIVQGFNPVSIVAPVGLNLWNAGLEDDIQASLSSAGADILWVQQSNLTFKKYFRHTSGNWRDVDNATVNLTQVEAEAIPLTGSVLIQRKSATPAEVDLKVPDTYSSF